MEVIIDYRCFMTVSTSRSSDNNKQWIDSSAAYIPEAKR